MAMGAMDPKSITRNRIMAHVTLAVSVRPTQARSRARLKRARYESMIIAIDGPSGAGKGTVAKAIAAHLGYRHVDTGAMYRAVAWQALQERLPLDDETAVGALAERVFIEAIDGVIRIDGHDVAHAIRTPEIDRAAAAAARLAARSSSARGTPARTGQGWSSGHGRP